jgi:hypothetical protein
MKSSENDVVEGSDFILDEETFVFPYYRFHLKAVLIYVEIEWVCRTQL